MAENDPRVHLIDLVTEFGTAMLITHTRGGAMRARPLSPATAHDDGLLYFATLADAAKVAEIAADPEVLVTMQQGARYASIMGAARIFRERALIDRIWSERWREWFPAGKDDPTLSILALAPRDAEYWDQRRGTSARL
jgi:general stress protein 26